MIITFTDFGLTGPYLGQMKAVLALRAPGVPVLDLFADAPQFDPRASSYLLAAYWHWFPEGTVFLAVVDPGVGTDRVPLVLRVDQRWFVGPDNGLAEQILRRGKSVECWRIVWRPLAMSNSFHGRDLFAPIAARLAQGENPAAFSESFGPARFRDWPDDLAEVVYADHYGNAMTGLRAQALAETDELLFRDTRIRRAATFGTVALGVGFYYVNSTGLIELAVNQGRATDIGLTIGARLELISRAR